MTLELYNTLKRTKHIFKPIDPQNVRMYVCGPTVYDYAHIGNARPIIIFDLLFRVLRNYYGPEHITYARNITDVDDKINKRAEEKNISIYQLTEQTIEQFHQDISALNVLRPTVEPKATDHITQMKIMIECLEEKGHAYVAEDHVLFHVPSMENYGKLSGRSIDEMQAGARVEVAPYKKDPMDFVLWKPSKEGEPSWPSPCNINTSGRPGWHIECSAMAAEHLGENFDIHGGGIDLVFPHHENEIAQSTCAHGNADTTEQMANVWMHNGFLQVEGEKMSKSLGNFITIYDTLQDWPGEAVRLTMLQTQYRQPINWTAKGLSESKKQLDKWYSVLKTEETDKQDHDTAICSEVLSALHDDLNTPKAISHLHSLYKHAFEGSKEAAHTLKVSAQLMGLLDQKPEHWFAWKPSRTSLNEAQIAELIIARNAARKNKDFAEADRIRDELIDMGIVLKDGPEGTTWSVS
ncbi:MAG: cysteine--tRNA ligase [Pseudomonadota bacterium]